MEQVLVGGQSNASYVCGNSRHEDFLCSLEYNFCSENIEASHLKYNQLDEEFCVMFAVKLITADKKTKPENANTDKVVAKQLEHAQKRKR